MRGMGVHLPSDTTESQSPLEDQAGQGECDPDSSGVATPTLVWHAVGTFSSNLIRASTLAGPTIPELQPYAAPESSIPAPDDVVAA